MLGGGGADGGNFTIIFLLQIKIIYELNIAFGQFNSFLFVLAIHRAAGPDLLQACYGVPEVSPGVRCPTGEARITP